MATKPSNHSAEQDQGAFGDQDKQLSKGQGEIHTDDDSTLNLGGANKRNPHGSEKQSSMDKNVPLDRKND